ncbi:MAG: flap endonuclease-1 [Candidatus Diapherotrites archaeon]
MGTAIGALLEKQNISLSDLDGQTIAIDSYNIIYQFLSSIRGPDGQPLMDAKGRVTSHLTGLLYRTSNLIEKGIKPVFVFDGKPHELKAETLKARHAIRTEAIEKHEKALQEGDMESAKKFGSRALKLTDEMLKDARFLLEALGLPVVQAPSEGEAQASYMALHKIVDACSSQDYDSLLFGAPVLLRNIAVGGRKKLPGRNVWIDVEPERIVLEENLQRLKISRQKLVWLGILIGTDFNEKFPKIGTKTAIKLVQEHDSFEEICKAAKFAPEFDYREIEKIFLEPEYNEKADVEFKPLDREKVLQFLVDERAFSRDRVESVLNRLEPKLEEKGKQSNLKKWF